MRQLLEKAETARQDLATHLVARLETAHPDIDADTKTRLAGEILDAAISIIPPQEEDPVVQFVTLQMAGRLGGSSVKPGNIILDVQKLLTSIGKIGLATAAIVAKPWLAPFALLVLWDDLYSRVKVNIQEREASVIWTVWLHKDNFKSIAKEGLLELVNQERSTSDRAALTQGELDDALGTLLKMRCIAESRQDPNKWWVRESVRINYK